MKAQTLRIDNRLVAWVSLIMALAAIGVLVRLPSHFWLDETMSYWAVGGGFHGMLARVPMWPQSIPYSTLVLALRSGGAHSEWIFRLPSFLAVTAAAWLLFRMARRLFGPEAAWITTAIFVLIPSVRFAACDARPYGIALLMVVVATDLFTRFLTRPDYKGAALYGLSAGGILCFQILFATVLLAHALYLLIRAICGERVRPRYVIVALAVFSVLAAPVIFQYLQLSGNPAAHSFSERPMLDDLASSYMPSLALYVFDVLAVLALVNAGLKWELADANEWSLLPVLMALLPPFLLFTVSRISPTRIFVPRYFLCYAPGLAMCLGLILASFRPALARTAILAVLALLAARSIGPPFSFHHTENYGDWGDTAAFVNRYLAQHRVPVFVRSQFPESDYFPLTPVDDNGLFSQLAYYPIDADVIPIPVTFTDRQASFLSNTLRNLPPATHRLLLVAMPQPALADAFVEYIRGRLGSACQVRTLARFDGVSVIEYAW